MQPVDQNKLQAEVEARYRVLLILWFAFLMSVGLYFVVSLFIQRPNGDDSQSRVLTFMFTAAGTFTTILSIVVKQKFLTQSAERQRPELVQTGYIIALALCETAALLGLMNRFITGNRYYFVLMIIAAIGMLLHWPRRDHLIAAYYEPRSQGFPKSSLQE
jgi:F0F1-type ATP synthase membrane subunit c/vacuolar-type H+-ATPase subunit K